LDRLNSKDLVLRIYTDDYKWAKSEFPVLFEGYTFDFSPEEYTDIDSLWTMSKHKYLIGANSTYSLWAYYLNQKNTLWASFPKEWKEGIESKGYALVIPEIHKNVHFINEG
jgi:hypothetical protein